MTFKSNWDATNIYKLLRDFIIAENEFVTKNTLSMSIIDSNFHGFISKLTLIHDSINSFICSIISIISINSLTQLSTQLTLMRYKRLYF